MSPDDGLERGEERLLFEGHPAVLGGVGALLLAILSVGIALIVYWVRSRRVLYRITTQRVVFEQGLFSKRLDQIDLYRIVDYAVERPFGQRLMGTGNLLLKTSDSTTPEVRVQAIRTDVVKLYEELRNATEAEKRRRGVRVVDME